VPWIIMPKTVEIRISLEPGLLKLLQDIAAERSIVPKVKALAVRLAASNVDLQATLDAYPDPDTTD